MACLAKPLHLNFLKSFYICSWKIAMLSWCWAPSWPIWSPCWSLVAFWLAAKSASWAHAPPSSTLSGTWCLSIFLQQKCALATPKVWWHNGKGRIRSKNFTLKWNETKVAPVNSTRKVPLTLCVLISLVMWVHTPRGPTVDHKPLLIESVHLEREDSVKLILLPPALSPEAWVRLLWPNACVLPNLFIKA
jgi:hypothetical protein